MARTKRQIRDRVCVVPQCTAHGQPTPRHVCRVCKTVTLPLAYFEEQEDGAIDIDTSKPLDSYGQIAHDLAKMGLQDAAPAQEHIFSIDAKDRAEIDPCARCGAAVVEVPSDIWYRWLDLARRVHTEWAAYLIGTVDAGQATVTGFTFPRQSVSGASVDIALDAPIPAGCIGTVHSHVGMEAFWSQTDKQHWNQPVHVVLNRRAEWKAVVRATLPCGAATFAPAEVALTGIPDDVAELDAQIIRPSPASAVLPIQQWVRGGKM